MERLVLTSQSLLTLIADLKRDALLSDFPAMNKLIDGRRARHEEARQQHEAKIAELLRCRFEEVGSESIFTKLHAQHLIITSL